MGNTLKLQKPSAPAEQPFPEVALRWLQLGTKAFVNEQLEVVRAEQQHIKNNIRPSIENYARLKAKRSNAA